MSLPNNFLLGGAIASSQADGGFNQGGKGLNTQDCRFFDSTWDFDTIYNHRAYVSDITNAELDKAINDQGTEYYPLRRGIDFYNKYPEDIKLFKELGLKIFRTSICWSRIFPNGDENEPNLEGIEYYRSMFNLLKENNIKIFTTINHYDMPIHLVKEYGGWKNRKTIDFFLNYVKVLFDNFKDVVDYWLPFNEINAARFAHWDGISVVEENEDNIDQTIFQCLHHQFIANAKVVELSKKIVKKKNIGAMVAAFTIYPATCNPHDIMQEIHDLRYANWFYFDVMARGYYPEYMQSLE